MTVHPASYCKRCRYYHGADHIVCGLHPYGPNSKTCSDYASKPCWLNPLRRGALNSRQLHGRKDWQKMLMLGGLVGILGLGFGLNWSLTTHPPQPTTKTPNTSGWVR